MKKIILALSLVASLSCIAISASADETHEPDSNSDEATKKDSN